MKCIWCIESSYRLLTGGRLKNVVFVEKYSEIHFVKICGLSVSSSVCACVCSCHTMLSELSERVQNLESVQILHFCLS